MPQITITSDALEELRDRIAREHFPSGVMILGPMENDPRKPDSVEEAWLLERAYGPAPRWLVSILPERVLEPVAGGFLANLYVEEIGGIRVGVATADRNIRLRVELHGDRIRVVETK